LEQCRAVAARAGRAQLVSISLEVGALDPLAVLESIFEPGELHCYVERRPSISRWPAPRAVLSFTAAGTDRFAACQRFIDETLAATIAVGDQRAPFAGPHFFMAFTFLPEVEAGESFPAAQVFVPRWQVASATDVRSPSRISSSPRARPSRRWRNVSGGPRQVRPI